MTHQPMKRNVDEPLGRILVVDDDPDLRKVMTTLLRGVGHDVQVAEDGATALHSITERPADVVLLDVSMPGDDGFAVMERINAMDDPPVVIFVTARGSRDDRLQGLFSGALTYITKPFEPAELVAQIASVMKQKRRLETAQTISRRDALTGLGNRLAFDQHLAAELARSARYRHSLTLVMLDADGLKPINDTHGHAAGDEMIRAIARAITATCRATDKSCRIGGDEFAILLPETDRDAASRFVTRMEAAFRQQQFPIGSESRSPSCSIGFALYPEDAPDAGSLQRCADAALYSQKRQRRSRSAST